MRICQSVGVALILFCAIGTAQANLITNADFSAGNTGFTSDYTFVTSNIAITEYGVVTDPQTWNTNLFSFGDHTPGPGGLMLVANGSSTAGLSVWRQTIATVTPNTTYLFSGFVASAFNQTAPVMEFLAGTTSLGTITPSIATPGTYAFFSGAWNSGSNTSVVLRIVDNNLEPQGNDVVIDDLSFVAVPEASTVSLIGLSGFVGMVMLRRRSRSTN
ncbi:MAG: PEP-CTERM sorting domain-containing protein [Fibrella sp.]|nr:PEP-CTERM sorting domain-containing protein [Armatimonadota bacterium]